MGFDLMAALRALKDRLNPPQVETINVDGPPRMRREDLEAAGYNPEQIEFSRQSGGLWDSTPPGYDDSFESGRREQIRRVAAGGDEEGLRALAAAGDEERARSAWKGRSNEENIRLANEGLAESRNARSPNANLSDEELRAKALATVTGGPPRPTPEGLALYEDLLAAAKRTGGGGGGGASMMPPMDAPAAQPPRRPAAPTTPPPQTVAQAATSPEKKAQAAPGGGALGADPRKAAVEMALAQIPNPDVRALLAKRMKLATDGDAELRAAQQKEERLTALAGLQRQLGKAASTLGDERYDDSGAAGAERAAAIGTRGVMARREGEDTATGRAAALLAQLERERAGRAGEGLDARRLAEDERKNREGEKIDWYNARSGRIKAEKDTSAGGEGNPKFENMVQKYAKDVAPLSEMSDAVERLQGVLARGGKPDGVGRLAGPLSAFGIGTPEGLQTRQDMQTIGNVILKARAGTAVSASESERVAIETGMSKWASPEQMRIGAEATIKVLRRSGANAKAKYPGAVSATFEERGGWSGDGARPAGGPRQISSQQEYDALPSGAEYTAPDGSRRRKR